MSQLKLDPIPEILEIEVTGRVKGESVAIVPGMLWHGDDYLRLRFASSTADS